MKRFSMWVFLLMILMVVYGCTDSGVTSKPLDSDASKIKELEKQNEVLKSENIELKKKLQHHLTEEAAFSEISMKTFAFMKAVIDTDINTIVALSEKDVPLFMKDKDIWTTYEELDLNLTHNAMNESLVSWFIEYIGFNPDTNEMQALVRPHHVDANNQSIQEADRYYNLFFTQVNDEWFISRIVK